MGRQVLTQEEIAAIKSLDFSDEGRSSSFWFVARSCYVLTYILAAVFALALYPEQVLGKFNIASPEMAAFMRAYVRVRVLFLCCIVPFYLWSYVRGFHFRYVSLAAFVIATTMFVNELVLFYAFAQSSSQGAVLLILSLRLSLLICLFLNFWEHRRN